MTKPIYQLVDELPENNITVMALKTLDNIVPGQWENITNFEEMIRKVTGETDEAMIQKIGERAVWLFNDKTQGYQNALWLYQTVDKADYALGAAALANKIGEKINLFGFLNRITPNDEKAQVIDLVIKIVAELVAFCQINGLPGDSISDFVAALEQYEKESLLRMAALVCFDAIIPFGADFVLTIQSTLAKLSPQELNQNPVFSQMSRFIPGDNLNNQLQFITESFEAVKGWMISFVTSNAITRSSIMANLHSFIEFSEAQFDYLAAFLDITTNYFEHTGIQSIARSLISRAMFEV
ncbi:MAG: hypothetical protein NZ901_01460 [Geminocystis sp.]|nr:hypothetical protein [Geminocystis sp.]HIK38459.1 hypothetical protein [Geminocystis sp. M7585_C2015_104]MCS7146836.1 hypothetical protein [Geminocystis sp.]MCX8078856.1 hypothetical protein [Geminocystis sp.]MDW8115661.1 hypothetical protein [Geminocystis sp.]